MGSPCKLPSASVVLPPGLGGFLSAPAEEAQEHRVTAKSLASGAGRHQVNAWKRGGAHPSLSLQRAMPKSG